MRRGAGAAPPRPRYVGAAAFVLSGLCVLAFATLSHGRRAAASSQSGIRSRPRLQSRIRSRKPQGSPLEPSEAATATASTAALG